MKVVNATAEAWALRRIGKNWRCILSGLNRSPIEAPCGGLGPYDCAVDRLRSSALVWPSVDAQAISDSTAAKLDRIKLLAIDAALLFEPLRVKESPALDIALAAGMPIGEWRETAWGDVAVFPPSVHRWAARTLHHMHTTSLPFLEDDSGPPSENSLLDAGFIATNVNPLEHYAAIAALVCVWRAIDLLEEVLTCWRGEFERRAPTLHFEGHHGTREWEEVLYSIRQDARLRSEEVENLGCVSVELAKADAWIGFAHHHLEAERRSNAAAERARLLERHAMTQKRSTAAASAAHSQAAERERNRKRVADAARRFAPGLTPSEQIAAVMAATGLSRPVVRDHLKALGVIPANLRRAAC